MTSRIEDPDGRISRPSLLDISMAYGGGDAEEIDQQEIRERTLRLSPHPIDQSNPKTQISYMFYLKPLQVYEKEKPFFLNIPVHQIENARQTNVLHTLRGLLLTDLRNNEEHFSLDTSGFQVTNFHTKMQYHDFEDPRKIMDIYYKETSECIADAIGREKVHSIIPWDYQVRRRNPNLPGNSRGTPGKAQPFAAIHADQTFRAAVRRLHYFHPKEAVENAQYRTLIVNVWRPLRGPVYDYPLAVCDYRTVDPHDRVPTDIVFPDYLGETYNFWPNPKHRWYYIDAQKENEALLVKCFDSKSALDPSVAQFSPHASFPYQDQPADTPHRESIEVRTFVFLKA
ncbi:uncharacterized protein DFL_009042 [Arthrobotrys flagrans]|uniref:Methyltransferase n=1 Tax=Arthrobotrys flagrans TaxID=97331 RepID=A0A436ZQI7_ARTFL|nr:hypothetical protein DFL_009042 [Arthrobotrys flagrans]